MNLNWSNIAELVVVMLLLLFFVVLTSVPRRGDVARRLTLLVAAAMSWTLAEVVANGSYTNSVISLYAWRVVFASTFIVAILLLRLVLACCKVPVSKLAEWGLLLLCVGVSVAVVSTNLVVQSTEVTVPSMISDFVAGAYTLSYDLIVLSIVVLSFVLAVINGIKAYSNKLADAAVSREKKSFASLILALFLPTIAAVVLVLIDVHLADHVYLLVFFATVVFFVSILMQRFFGVSFAAMPIKAKIKLPILAIIVLVVFGGTIVIYREYSRLTGERTDEALVTSTSARALHVETWLAEKKDVVTILSSGRSIVDVFTTPIDSTAYAEVESIANDRLSQALIVSSDLLKLTMIDSDLNVRVSTDETDLDIEREEIEEFMDEFGSSTPGITSYLLENLHWSNSEQLPCLDIISLINDTEGNFLGAVVVDIDAEALFVITGNNDGYGETGESLLVDTDNRLVSPLRNRTLPLFETIVNTDIVNHCLSEKSTEISTLENYTDYRGVFVTGAAHYIPEGQWCLISKIDENELEQPVQQFAIGLVAVGIGTIILLSVVADYGIRSLIQPVEVLRKGVEVIAAGDLDYKVGTKVEDEVGELSRAFDRLTAAVKESRLEVDQKVNEQTKVIQANAVEIEDKQKALVNILDDVETDRERLDTILHSIGDGVFVVDANKKIILFNEAAVRISRYTAEEAVGKSLTDTLNFVYEKDGKPNTAFIDTAITEGVAGEMANHTVLIIKDGKKIPVADSAAPLKDKEGHVIGCVVVFRDVTHEREVDRMKTEFVSLASHQLKTPLTSIRWYSDMLRDESAGKLSTKQKDIIEQVYLGSRRMVRLINDLLSISRLESGRLKIVPVPGDFIKVTEQIIASFAPYCGKGGCTISFDKPTKKLSLTPIDETLFTQILTNFIANAVRYSPKGRCEVTVGIKENIKGGKVVEYEFKVADKGIGIPAKAQPRLFEKFFRADNAAKMSAEGSGLGLYVAKTVVEAYGGRLWFESKEGVGSTFYFTLPVSGMKEKEGDKGLAMNEV